MNRYSATSAVEDAYSQRQLWGPKVKFTPPTTTLTMTDPVCLGETVDSSITCLFCQHFFDKANMELKKKITETSLFQSRFLIKSSKCKSKMSMETHLIRQRWETGSYVHDVRDFSHSFKPAKMFSMFSVKGGLNRNLGVWSLKNAGPTDLFSPLHISAGVYHLEATLPITTLTQLTSLTAVDSLCV